MGRGGGQVVSVLAFYSDDPGLNPAEAYCFFLQNLCLKRTKIYKEIPGLAFFKKRKDEMTKARNVERLTKTEESPQVINSAPMRGDIRQRKDRLTCSASEKN